MAIQFSEKSALFKVMAWCRKGNNPLREQMLPVFSGKTIGQAKNAHTWVWLKQNIFATVNEDSGGAHNCI